MKLLLLVCVSLLLISYNIEPDKVFIPVRYEVAVTVKDTVYLDTSKTDTVYVPNNLERYLTDEKDLESFITYINTQAGGIKTLKQSNDNWIVLQCMKHLMLHNKCNWTKYYNTPSINYSASIRKLKTNPDYFSQKRYRDNPRFKEMKNRALLTLLNLTPKDKLIPHNVMTFESCPRSPNRGAHPLRLLYRHDMLTSFRAYYYPSK